MQALSFGVLYVKYYIYIQHLFNNNTLDLYACLTQLKQALIIEEHILCIKTIMHTYFSTSTLSLRTYKTKMKMTL